MYSTYTIKKQVTFAEEVQTYWIDNNPEECRGCWMLCAADRARFERRIRTYFEPLLKSVLENKIKKF